MRLMDECILIDNGSDGGRFEYLVDRKMILEQGKPQICYRESYRSLRVRRQPEPKMPPCLTRLERLPERTPSQGPKGRDKVGRACAAPSAARTAAHHRQPGSAR